MAKLFRKNFISLKTIFTAFKNGSYEELYNEYLKLNFQPKYSETKIKSYNMCSLIKNEPYVFDLEEAKEIIYQISLNSKYKLKYHPFFYKTRFPLQCYFNIGDNNIYDIDSNDRKGWGQGEILYIYSGGDFMRVKFKNKTLPVMVSQTLYTYDRSSDYLKTIIEELNGEKFNEEDYKFPRCYFDYELKKLGITI